jgi:glutamate racemase
MPAVNLTNFSDEEPPDKDAPIAFLDSGVGGLPYLQWVRKHLPDENFIYLADRKHFPYGTKTAGEVFAAVAEGVEKCIAAFHPKLFVLACNTASVSALERLRAEFPGKTFVGTVPAVKPAAQCSRNKRIGVLATGATIHAHYLDELIERFASSCTIIRVPGPDIVNFVEKKFFTSTPEERLLVVADAVEKFREEGVDTLVLACTHFLYLYDEIHAELGGDVRIIDSREGVGRRVMDILDTDHLRRQVSSGHPFPPRLYLSGDDPPETQYAFFADYFKIELAGLL